MSTKKRLLKPAAGKRNRVASADRFEIEFYHRRISVRPLFGLQRLVRIERRNWNGVLLCDSVATVANTVTFSRSNINRASFETLYRQFNLGFLGEPQLSVANEAPPEQIERFRDEGREFLLRFTPEKGKTYSFQCDVYRPIETFNGTIRADIGYDQWIETFALAVDLSAYVDAGCSIHTPMCEFEKLAENGQSKVGREAKPIIRRLSPSNRTAGSWEWRIHDLTRGMIRAAWAIDNRGFARPFSAASLERLTTELKVDPHLAKHLCNYVSLCHYYAAGFRSMHAIEREMAITRSALARSLESIEQLIGAELFERTRGKGLIQVTPAGEDVLEWWTRFYLRWTPIAPDSAAN